MESSLTGEKVAVDQEKIERVEREHRNWRGTRIDRTSSIIANRSVFRDRRIAHPWEREDCLCAARRGLCWMPHESFAWISLRFA
jgi:hypothetical protein